jgi:ABC-2 type transport system ATP-binding protein
MTTATANCEPAIRLINLTKRYGERASVDDVSFSVPTGVVCGFIGQNGAGKTTTIRLLLGLITPTAGTAEVLGKSIAHPEEYLDQVGAMIEGPAFYPTLSARQNLRVLTRLGGLDDGRIDAVLARVDLTDRADDLFRSFSLGMKQRLGIAAALLPDPSLLILDEPTNGLDPQGIREVRTLLRALADGGITVLVSSHLLDELQQICDHVVLIDRGQLRFDGTIDELLERQTPALAARPEHPGDCEELARVSLSLGYAAVVDDETVRVDAPPSFAADLNRAASARGITLVHLTTEQARLEDVFLGMTSSPGELATSSA